MRRTVRALIVAVSAVTALLAAAGCGSSGSPGASTSAAALTKPAGSTLADKVASAVTHATSVHMTGWATESGQSMYLDFSMTKSGGISGSFSLGSAADQLTFMETGGKVYFKMTPSFVKVSRLPSATCALMCGRWFEESGASAKGMTGAFSWAGFTGSMSKPPSSATVSGPVTVDRIQTWVIHTPSDGTFYVAARGTPYPVRAIGPNGEGRIDFTNWNTAVIPPPPTKDLVSLNQLMKVG